MVLGDNGVVKLSLDLLKPDPQNARQISDRALDGLKVSAETFGDLSGITWNEQLGLLVAGHQRMRVLRAAGATEWVREAGNAAARTRGDGVRGPPARGTQQANCTSRKTVGKQKRRSM